MVLQALSALLVALASATSVPPSTNTVVWKPLENAVLKIDEKPARIWNVYRAEKKDHWLLVQLGRRFLMLDVHEKEIFELDPAKLERKDKELLWHEADKPAKPLPSSDWLVRDAGRARRIRTTLAAEGRVLEVQVPIQPDMRSLY